MVINEVAPDVYLVPIPIPVPLKSVNAYALRGAHGWTLVDTGFHDEVAEATWRAAFRDLGIGPGDVEQILVTHLHPDHFGAAGWLQELTGAPVLMHAPEVPHAERVWDPERQQGDHLIAFFRSHGMPAERAEVIGSHQRRQQNLVAPLPRVTPVPPGSVIRLGRRRFRVIWTPGHTDGLAVFLSEEDGLLLANDMVLMKITPNIPLWPGINPDPLGSFLGSLRQVAGLPVRQALPGHRLEIPDVPGRCAEIAGHHAERLTRVLEIAGPRGATGWDVSLALFGDLPDLHQTRFAMAEGLSHLEYLARRERLRRHDEDGVIRYALPPGTGAAPVQLD